MKYTKCHLWPTDGNVGPEMTFEEVSYLDTPDGGPGADHYDRYLVKCIKCNVFYIKQIIEWWSPDGDDNYSIKYIPVNLENLNDRSMLDWSDISSDHPYITKGEKGSWIWINKFSQNRILEAVEFAISSHKGQTRKGKDIPYITHPMAVALILSEIKAPQNVIIAGLLHDTIEDSGVTYEDLKREFGKDIADMVNDVTEQDKSLPWAVRKQQALEHIAVMGNDSILVKSADVLHNMSDQLADYKIKGDAMYENFNAPKEAQLERYRKLIAALDSKWPENPLLPELKKVYNEFERLMK